MSLADVAAATGAAPAGPVDPSALITAVTADSRQVGPGSLFVALPGERVDGRDFVPAAVGAGALAALTAAAVDGAPCLVVADPLAAFGAIARRVVEGGVAGGLQVVGVTGSQGKTSTKDLLAAILESAGPTVAPVGNLNNELGLPLTVARVEPDTRFLVAEMGARGIGHIAYLCDICPPVVGVELNVGHAHVGEFGGQAQIARAKSELVAALPAAGTAVLNYDDPYVWGMRAVTSARVLAFSAAGPPTHEDAVWATDVSLDDLGRPRFTLHARFAGAAENTAEVGLRLVGRHHIANATAAAGAALALGLGLDQVADALSGATARSRWRMELTERADGLVVLNDSYNANPESMAAALDALAELGRRRPGATTWALLGDMLELGDEAAAGHDALGRRVAEAGIDRLIAVGAFAETVVGGARASGLDADRAYAAADKAAMLARVLADAQPGDIVLVKASRGLALDTVAADLLTADPRREPTGEGRRASDSQGPSGRESTGDTA
ncbi:UDP-N-acetylmuramoyl-tripeptide--D-alanyl-D-alanine ligase [Microlunatus ginsengisoli]|uniref:UDP-N-acetylmuramoyl-tripeptide--D-alanyl-D- alanine ligase n=1 Tax=Microlunatus ginsengisoli TaxID=363863 RepID=UPI0031D61EB9